MPTPPTPPNVDVYINISGDATSGFVVSPASPQLNANQRVQWTNSTGVSIKIWFPDDQTVFGQAIPQNPIQPGETFPAAAGQGLQVSGGSGSHYRYVVYCPGAIPPKGGAARGYAGGFAQGNSEPDIDVP